MRVLIDIEADGLENVKNIWLIVCKNIDDGTLSIFREVTTNVAERERFRLYVQSKPHWIGHNILGYDLPVLASCLGFVEVDPVNCTDTLIISKMADYPRKGDGGDEKKKHSIEAYGEEFTYHKGEFKDFTKWSQEMEDYCVRDVEIAEKVYLKYRRYINNPDYQEAIRLEHSFQLVVNDLHNNGFAFDSVKANVLLAKVTKELGKLDEQILVAFPPKLKLVREINPKETKHGTLNRQDFRFDASGDLSEYNGGPFCRCSWTAFNPASHKQVIDVLHQAGWSPVEKTKTHIDLEREAYRAKSGRNSDVQVDLAAIHAKLKTLETYGFKISEVNLLTLPDDAPPAAKLLAKRILLESRRRTLSEWLALVNADGRIHGKFFGIGAWTHRMAHQNPNTANIPTEAKLFGKEMRSLWIAPKNRLLVGVDAEGIQLRIFAHYINDPEFIDALVRGRKEDGTDPHSLNQRILRAKYRKQAKNFIFAYLLGGGIPKLATLLDFSENETRDALERLVDRYKGLQTLKNTVIPADAKRGWFTGLDGRPVRIPSETAGGRRHLCLAGYLQNGEAIVIKRFTIKAAPRIKLIDPTVKIVNLVHDEKIDETSNDFDKALKVAQINAECLKEVGQDLKLNCPLAGSYWNDDAKDYTIGTTWYATH